MKQTFGRRLAAIRLLRDMTQAGLAESTGLKQSAINHFEKDRRLPSFGNVVRLADALDCSADLFYRSDAPLGRGERA
jgi:transcriptional regulator with XRE-family HTH domain